ncbi:sulfurtransferase TusA family protein [Catenovulum sp. SM1970]|uniref:sulfurtransferase TusA family protein n=1 Tax=Marinifaba aquimaris TaxID=2741323 RepID=UPI001574D398|nr:sulfurtransferase TusA family protein [Marinifaba aquimaris]
MQHFLDATSLKCPMPLLKLKLLLKKCELCDTIELLVADNASVKDIPAWAEKKGYLVQCNKINNHVVSIMIKFKEC